MAMVLASGINEKKPVLKHQGKGHIRAQDSAERFTMRNKNKKGDLHVLFSDFNTNKNSNQRPFLMKYHSLFLFLFLFLYKARLYLQANEGCISPKAVME